MGTQSSKERQVEETIINAFLTTHMPLFLEKHCRVEEGRFIDPAQFWLAFKSALQAENIKIPRHLYRIDSDWLKYYFHQLDKRWPIYITGAPAYNVLVGVSIEKWPGTPETDNRAKRNDTIGLRMLF
jgi:hypothetical protein